MDMYSLHEGEDGIRGASAPLKLLLDRILKINEVANDTTFLSL